MTGKYPDHKIDHKDRNTSNNKWNNLRKVTGSQNNYNSKIPKNNTSGVKGVSYIKERKKWYASIRINGKTKALGKYDSLEEAKKVRQEVAKKFFGEFYNG